MKHSLYAGVAAIALGFASPAMAGTIGHIVLTGHDNDFHEDAGAVNATKAELNYVRAGSALPVLVIDAGSQAQNLMTNSGVAFVAVTPGALTNAMFNNSLYSAFVVASVSTCGGCDNPPGTGTLIATHSTAITAFFNNGGGILGETSADDGAGYAYVPEAAASSPIFSSSGFVATTNGLTDLGSPYTAVNGDQTHNTFSAPGTGGTSGVYKVAETFGTGGPAVTIYAAGTITCTGTHCHLHGAPEPMTLSLLGAGLFGLGVARRRWRK